MVIETEKQGKFLVFQNFTNIVRRGAFKPNEWVREFFAQYLNGETVYDAAKIAGSSTVGADNVVIYGG